MKLFNSLTQRKDEFIPIDPTEIKIYACGPTVYNYFHIGNARPLVVFDTLRRYLKWHGKNVKFVQNFTDIDDKIIRRAAEEGISAAEVAEKYTNEYFADAKGLNALPADVHPKATEHVDQIIAMIETLIEKNHAYPLNGDVYYSARSFKGYGKLSRQSLGDLEAGARIDVNEQKRDPADFALWKSAKPGEPSWDSPWGKGRPGWHIECSVMAKEHLGDTIDIHCGGIDIMFPHHENEIAQSEAANGVPFANFWLHNGLINVDNSKMSKSKGNFFTTRDVAEMHGYEPIRFFLLSAHYRSPVNYSIANIEQAKAGLARLYNCRDNLDFLAEQAADGGMKDEEKAFSKTFGLYKERFIEAMEDDLNTADALAPIFDLVRDINGFVQGETVTKSFINVARGTLSELCSVLGLLESAKADEIPAEVASLAEKRAEARKAKDFKLADTLREEIRVLGYTLEDTPSGVKITRLS